MRERRLLDPLSILIWLLSSTSTGTCCYRDAEQKDAHAFAVELHSSTSTIATTVTTTTTTVTTAASTTASTASARRRRGPAPPRARRHPPRAAETDRSPDDARSTVDVASARVRARARHCRHRARRPATGITTHRRRRRRRRHPPPRARRRHPSHPAPRPTLDARQRRTTSHHHRARHHHRHRSSVVVERRRTASNGARVDLKCNFKSSRGTTDTRRDSRRVTTQKTNQPTGLSREGKPYLGFTRGVASLYES